MVVFCFVLFLSESELECGHILVGPHCSAPSTTRVAEACTPLSLSCLYVKKQHIFVKHSEEERRDLFDNIPLRFLL